MRVLKFLGLGIVTLAVLATLSCGLDWAVPGTSAPKHTSYPSVVMDVRDASLQDSALAWQTEVHRRFSSAVVILCHGGAIVKDQWIIQDAPGDTYPCEPTDKVISDERAEYPDRTIVLLACNTGNFVLHGFPNVFYATSEVWTEPDRSTSVASADCFTTTSGHHYQRKAFTNRSETYPDFVGNVWEFIEAN